MKNCPTIQSGMYILALLGRKYLAIFPVSFCKIKTSME